MSANATIPPELAELIEELARRQAGAMSIQLAELAELLKPQKNTRDIPPQRATFGSLAELGTEPFQIIGRRADRARVVVVNLDSTADDLVWVATSATAVAQDSTAFPLPGASSALSRIELSTQDDIWVRAKTAATPIAWIIFDFDAG
jgi:hypothetical protein